MVVENKSLILDLLEWVAAKPRTYVDVMEAWRTSCPRLTIWEDAVHLGFVACEHRDSFQTMVNITSAGRTFLEAERPDGGRSAL